MGKVWVVCVLLVCLLGGDVYAEDPAEAQQRLTEELLEDYADLYGKAFEQGMKNQGLSGAFTELIPEFRMKDLFAQLLSGKTEVSFGELARLLWKFLLGEVYRSFKLMAVVLAASVLCSYLTGLQEGFGSRGVSQAAYYACYVVIAGVASAAFYDAAGCVSEGIQQIALFMEMVVPIVMTALVTSGAVISASVFEPVLLTVVGVAMTVIQGVFIPLVMMSTGLNIVNGISDRFKIDKLIKLINQCIKWGLSVMLTIFVSTAGIQSIASSGADGLTIKLTKFAASNLIPVVGGILSESVETVMNCSALIKNAVGLVGIIGLAIIAVTPLLKIAAVLLIFRLTAAIAEPVSEPRMVACLTALANAISVLFSMLAAATVMFMIILTIMIHAGNTVMILGR